MKKTLLLLICITLMCSCRHASDIETARTGILEAEKAFEKMASEKGLAEAFWYFADENAVILRGNDSLITGKDNIRNYYEINPGHDVKLTWNPDFIGVSDCGSLGYTYGKFLYSTHDSTGKTIERKGIFHTVWKKTEDGWKYVWD